MVDPDETGPAGRRSGRPVGQRAASASATVSYRAPVRCTPSSASCPSRAGVRSSIVAPALPVTASSAVFVAVTSPDSSGSRENDQLGARGGDLDGREELAYVLPSVVRGPLVQDVVRSRPDNHPLRIAVDSVGHRGGDLVEEHAALAPHGDRGIEHLLPGPRSIWESPISTVASPRVR